MADLLAKAKARSPGSKHGAGMITRRGVARGVTVAKLAWVRVLPSPDDLLGHSSTRITGDVYAHTSDGAASNAMDVLGEALG